jgi:hypothetical protein
LKDGHDALHSERHDDMASIGGEFRLSAATEHYFAGSALVLVDDAGNEAAERLEQALSLCEAGPGPGEQHWFGAKAMTSIDLATVRLRSGALDAAVAAIEPALSLPSARRINALMTPAAARADGTGRAGVPRVGAGTGPG